MKNVLVSKEKFRLMKISLETFKEMLGVVAKQSEALFLINEIIAMPDFVESEEDVEKIAVVLFNEQNDYHLRNPYREYFKRLAQAAINALKIKEE